MAANSSSAADRSQRVRTDSDDPDNAPVAEVGTSSRTLAHDPVIGAGEAGLAILADAIGPDALTDPPTKPAAESWIQNLRPARR